jgi:hypothetical protein
VKEGQKILKTLKKELGVEKEEPPKMGFLPCAQHIALGPVGLPW